MSHHTRLVLGEYFDDFIASLIRSGAFRSPSEVVRAGLRLLEEQSDRARVVRELVRVGTEAADRGDFVDLTLEDLYAEIDAVEPKSVS